MNLMKILFGFFIFKSIFHEAQPCNIENNYYYDCDDYGDYEDCSCLDDCYETVEFDLCDLFDLY